MDAARREQLLAEYEVYSRRFDQIAAGRDQTVRPVPPTDMTEVPANEIFNLSDRQLEVLTLVAAGLPNEEIGTELHVTLDTVKTHVQHILRALGARNRAHAVLLGFRHRLLE
jgi:DNA-binding NarL/FixJ family response regulator